MIGSRFDAYLAGKAREAGVQVRENERVLALREDAGGVEVDNTAEAPIMELAAQTDYEECLACQ